MLFKSLGINQPLAIDELPHVVNIGTIFTLIFLQHSDIFRLTITFLNILGILTPVRQEMVQFLLMEG